MTLKPPSKPSSFARAVRAGIVGLGVMAAGAAVSSGCLDRPVVAATPKTTNVFVDQIIQTAVDKIDLLFMIDNSLSMADKQILLRDAVPQLVSRLVTPICVCSADEDIPGPCGAACTARPPPAGDGSAGTNQPEFKPIDNIHIGIVTSSLGGHGADICSPANSNFNPTQDDKAHLIPSVRNPTPPQYGNTGFLAWDPNAKHAPPGEANAGALISNFQAQVTASGENGCGFEASLEAWYRFLIDPDPPTNVVFNPATGVADVQGPDDVLKAQRAAFLRPDSLVAIIMLTDENDCSTIDGGIGWLPGQASQGAGTFHLPPATASCGNNPNDPCCRSCGLQEGGPPAGCAPLNADPGCGQGHNTDTDALNLRCWDQRRRFGLDFLYPISRYVDGLTQPQVFDRGGNLVPNPLYSDLQNTGQPSRHSSLVFLAGIIGVPWQDIATDDPVTGTLNDPNRLRFLTSPQLREKDRWSTILGDPANYIPPSDPLMVETPQDRTVLIPGATNPVTGAALAPATAQGSSANPINGHEYNAAPQDLQYACIFPLAAPFDCAAKGTGCDCTATDVPRNKPLCNGTTQTHAKAYPGIRHLQVLKGMGETGTSDNGIVASICPKITDTGNPDYGYNPAVAAIIERLKEALSGRCLPRPLAVDPDTGAVPCAVVEAIYSTSGCGACDPNLGRVDLAGDKAALSVPVLENLGRTGQCGGQTGKNCADFCLCEILPAEGAVRDSCLNNPTPPANEIGYCYVDPFNPDPRKRQGAEALVAPCSESEKRLLRFIGDNTPAKGAIAFIACLGDVITVSSGGGGDAGP